MSVSIRNLIIPRFSTLPALDPLISLSSMAIAMIRPTTPGLLEELQSPKSLTSQTNALKALKNEVVGHDDKKALWVRLGALVPVIQIIESSRSSGKQRRRELNGTDVSGKHLTDIEEARLQAIVIVDSFARGWSSCYPNNLVSADLTF